jgi:hypothetical protein
MGTGMTALCACPHSIEKGGIENKDRWSEKPEDG